MRTRVITCLALVTGLLVGVPVPASAAADTTERVSVGIGGAQASMYGISSEPSVSADGRYVAFTSAASNLVAGDTNGFVDVFVHDRTATTRRSVLGITTFASVRNGTLRIRTLSRNKAVQIDGVALLRG